MLLPASSSPCRVGPYGAGTSLTVTLLLGSRCPDVLAEYARGLAGLTWSSMWGRCWSGRCCFCCPAGATAASLSSVGIMITRPLMQQNLRHRVQTVHHSKSLQGQWIVCCRGLTKTYGKLGQAPFPSGRLFDVGQAYLSTDTARGLLQKLPCSFGAFNQSEAFTSWLLNQFCRC